MEEKAYLIEQAFRRLGPLNHSFEHLWTPLAATPLLWLVVTLSAYATAARSCFNGLPGGAG
jgi:hypothetical protein